MKSVRPIPALAFGNRLANDFDDPERMAAGLAASTRATLNYRTIDRSAPFFSRASAMTTQSVRVVTSVSSAVEADAYAPSSIGVLLLPLTGVTRVEYGRRTVEWGAAVGAAFLPSDRCVVRASTRSLVSIDIDPVVTERVLRAMLGDVAEKTIANAIDHATPRMLPRRRGRAPDLADVLLRHVACFDTLGCDPQLIQRSGLDDALLRTAILYLCPDLLSGPAEPLDRKKSTVDLVCDYIEANLTSRITLTDLERVSGLSARRLQYAFRATFDKTPGQWVTERRLDAVRKQILAAPEGATVTWIAGEYFSHLGEFARLYRERFGELPSDTLKNVSSRRLR